MPSAELGMEKEETKELVAAGGPLLAGLEAGVEWAKRHGPLMPSA